MSYLDVEKKIEEYVIEFSHISDNVDHQTLRKIVIGIKSLVKEYNYEKTGEILSEEDWEKIFKEKSSLLDPLVGHILRTYTPITNEEKIEFYRSVQSFLHNIGRDSSLEVVKQNMKVYGSIDFAFVCLVGFCAERMNSLPPYNQAPTFIQWRYILTQNDSLQEFFYKQKKYTRFDFVKIDVRNIKKKSERRQHLYYCTKFGFMYRNDVKQVTCLPLHPSFKFIFHNLGDGFAVSINPFFSHSNLLLIFFEGKIVELSNSEIIRSFGNGFIQFEDKLNHLERIFNPRFKNVVNIPRLNEGNEKEESVSNKEENDEKNNNNNRDTFSRSTSLRFRDSEQHVKLKNEEVLRFIGQFVICCGPSGKETNLYYRTGFLAEAISLSVRILEKSKPRDLTRLREDMEGVSHVIYKKDNKFVVNLRYKFMFAHIAQTLYRMDKYDLLEDFSTIMENKEQGILSYRHPKNFFMFSNVYQKFIINLLLINHSIPCSSEFDDRVGFHSIPSEVIHYQILPFISEFDVFEISLKYVKKFIRMNSLKNKSFCKKNQLKTQTLIPKKHFSEVVNYAKPYKIWKALHVIICNTVRCNITVGVNFIQRKEGVFELDSSTEEFVFNESGLPSLFEEMFIHNESNDLIYKEIRKEILRLLKSIVHSKYYEKNSKIGIFSQNIFKTLKYIVDNHSKNHISSILCDYDLCEGKIFHTHSLYQTDDEFRRNDFYPIFATFVFDMLVLFALSNDNICPPSPSLPKSKLKCKQFRMEMEEFDLIGTCLDFIQPDVLKKSVNDRSLVDYLHFDSFLVMVNRYLLNLPIENEEFLEKIYVEKEARSLNQSDCDSKITISRVGRCLLSILFIFSSLRLIEIPLEQIQKPLEQIQKRKKKGTFTGKIGKILNLSTLIMFNITLLLKKKINYQGRTVHPFSRIIFGRNSFLNTGRKDFPNFLSNDWRASYFPIPNTYFSISEELAERIDSEMKSCRKYRKTKNFRHGILIEYVEILSNREIISNELFLENFISSIFSLHNFSDRLYGLSVQDMAPIFCRIIMFAKELNRTHHESLKETYWRFFFKSGFSSDSYSLNVKKFLRKYLKEFDWTIKHDKRDTELKEIESSSGLFNFINVMYLLLESFVENEKEGNCFVVVSEESKVLTSIQTVIREICKLDAVDKLENSYDRCCVIVMIPKLYRLLKKLVMNCRNNGFADVVFEKFEFVEVSSDERIYSLDKNTQWTSLESRVKNLEIGPALTASLYVEMLSLESNCEEKLEYYFRRMEEQTQNLLNESKKIDDELFMSQQKEDGTERKREGNEVNTPKKEEEEEVNNPKKEEEEEELPNEQTTEKKKSKETKNEIIANSTGISNIIQVMVLFDFLDRKCEEEGVSNRIYDDEKFLYRLSKCIIDLLCISSLSVISLKQRNRMIRFFRKYRKKLMIKDQDLVEFREDFIKILRLKELPFITDQKSYYHRFLSFFLGQFLGFFTEHAKEHPHIIMCNFSLLVSLLEWTSQIIGNRKYTYMIEKKKFISSLQTILSCMRREEMESNFSSLLALLFQKEWIDRNKQMSDIVMIILKKTLMTTLQQENFLPKLTNDDMNVVVTGIPSLVRSFYANIQASGEPLTLSSKADVLHLLRVLKEHLIQQKKEDLFHSMVDLNLFLSCVEVLGDDNEIGRNSYPIALDHIIYFIEKRVIDIFSVQNKTKSEYVMDVLGLFLKVCVEKHENREKAQVKAQVLIREKVCAFSKNEVKIAEKSIPNEGIEKREEKEIIEHFQKVKELRRFGFLVSLIIEECFKTGVLDRILEENLERLKNLVYITKKKFGKTEKTSEKLLDMVQRKESELFGSSSFFTEKEEEEEEESDTTVDSTMNNNNKNEKEEEVKIMLPEVFKKMNELGIDFSIFEEEEEDDEFHFQPISITDSHDSLTTKKDEENFSINENNNIFSENYFQSHQNQLNGFNQTFEENFVEQKKKQEENQPPEEEKESQELSDYFGFEFDGGGLSFDFDDDNTKVEKNDEKKSTKSNNSEENKKNDGEIFFF